MFSVPDGRAANQLSLVTTFRPPIFAPLPGASVSLASMSSPASWVAVTSSPDRAANLAFCSSVVGVSTRLYQLSPKRSTCS